MNKTIGSDTGMKQYTVVVVDDGPNKLAAPSPARVIKDIRYVHGGHDNRDQGAGRAETGRDVGAESMNQMKGGERSCSNSPTKDKKGYGCWKKRVICPLSSAF